MSTPVTHPVIKVFVSNCIRGLISWCWFWLCSAAGWGWLNWNWLILFIRFHIWYVVIASVFMQIIYKTFEMYYGIELVVPFFSGSQVVIEWQILSFKMMKFLQEQSHYSLNSHFEWKKMSFDDFLMMTWEREEV